MRIIHVSTKKNHPAYSNVIFLQAKKHVVLFVVLDLSENPQYHAKPQYKEEGVTYIHLDVRKNFDFASDPKLESAFLNILKEFNPDIIHMQLFSGMNALSILQASSGTLAKKIMTLHTHSLFCLTGACFDKGQVCPLDTMEQCFCESCQSSARRDKLTLLKYNKIRKGRCKEIISLTDMIICCSHWQQDAIRRLLGKQAKTVVLHHGFNFAAYEYKLTLTKHELEAADINWKEFLKKITRYNWGEKINSQTFRFQKDAHKEKDKIQEALGPDFIKMESVMRQPIKKSQRTSALPCFGYLGSLWELKGITVLLHAIEQLRHLKFQLLMGIRVDPSNAKNVARLKKLEQHTQIRVMSNLTRDDLHKDFFSQIDYLIIPSVWEETGPMTLFESFFYKIPVIITDRSSMVEKTNPGDNSLIFDNENTLARIMKDAIENRISLGSKTRTNFPVKTFKEYADMLERVYAGKVKSIAHNSFTLNVGSLCNSDCVFCVRATNEAIKKVTFNVLIDILRKYSGQYDNLKITGGEPTLRKDLASLMQAADQLGYKKIFIETNARMFANAKLAQKIMSYRPEIVAHLESYKPLIHDRINRKKGSFVETVAGIRNILTYEGRVTVKIMILKDNYRGLLKTAKFIAKLGGIHKILFVFLDPGGYAHKHFDMIVPQYSKVRPYLEDALNWLMQNEKIKFALEDFPFCCLPSHLRGFESKRLKKTKLKALSYSPRPEKALMYAPLFERRKRKVKSPVCRLCQFNAVCEGFYDIYTHHYGWQEFQPVNPGGETAISRPPKRIDLKTGFLCHNNCRFCVQADKKKLGNKKTEELKDSLFKSAQEGYKAVVFTGGEATIRPDIIEIVKYAKKSGFELIQLQSNGRRFADIDFCEEIIAAGANEFSPALHGSTPEIHDFLTRSKGSFLQTVKGIRNLKKLKQPVITNTVITKVNYKDLPQIAKLLTQLRVNQFQMAFVHALGNAKKYFDDIVPRKLLVAPYVKKALDIGIYAGIRVMTEAIPFCFMKGYEAYVAENIIPDTKIIDFDQAIENYTEIRRTWSKTKAEKCRVCKYFDRCEGPWKEYPEHFGWKEFKPVK